MESIPGFLPASGPLRSAVLQVLADLLDSQVRVGEAPSHFFFGVVVGFLDHLGCLHLNLLQLIVLALKFRLNAALNFWTQLEHVLYLLFCFGELLVTFGLQLLRPGHDLSLSFEVFCLLFGSLLLELSRLLVCFQFGGCSLGVFLCLALRCFSLTFGVFICLGY